jgi:hypothetical protein
VERLNILGSLVLAGGAVLEDLADELGVDAGAADALHHGQVLEVVVGLEEGVAGEELDEDAADAPDVAGEAPAEIEDDLGGAVVAGGDDGGVVLVVEGGGAEVDEADVRVEQDAALAGVARDGLGGGGDGAVVGEGLVGVADEEDVFGFEVGVDEIEVMEDWIYKYNIYI